MLNREENMSLQIIDPPTHVEEIVDDNAELTESHHTSGVDVLPPCINLEENVVCEGIEYDSKDVSPPTFLSKGDVVIDTPALEIIVDILCHETMVMSSSQPMTPMLCQVVPYPPLEENDELMVK